MKNPLHIHTDNILSTRTTFMHDTRNFYIKYTSKYTTLYNNTDVLVADFKIKYYINIAKCVRENINTNNTNQKLKHTISFTRSHT